MVCHTKQKTIIAHDPPSPFWSEILYVSAKYFAIFFILTLVKRVWRMFYEEDRCALRPRRCQSFSVHQKFTYVDSCIKEGCGAVYLELALIKLSRRSQLIVLASWYWAWTMYAIIWYSETVYGVRRGWRYRLRFRLLQIACRGGWPGATGTL